MEKKIEKFHENMSSIWEGARALACTIPGPLVATYVLAISYMNLFAVKEFPISDIAVIDCAFLLSWVPFVVSDILIKLLDFHAAIAISIFAASCNTLFSILLWFVTKIPSSFGGLGDLPEIQYAVEIVLGSHVSIIFGSAFALIISTAVKGFCMYRMDKKSDDPLSIKTVYKEVSVSSVIGQLVDNSIFAFFSSFLLFHWSFRVIVVSIIIKTLIEVFMEIICFPVGYMTIMQWKEDGIGEPYASFLAQAKEAKRLRRMK